MLKYFMLGYLLMLFSCVPKEERKSNYLSHQDLINTMIQLKLIEVMVEKSDFDKDKKSMIYRHYESKYLDSVSIKRKDYKETLEYYLRDLQKGYDLYTEVLDSMTVRSKNNHIF